MQQIVNEDEHAAFLEWLGAQPDYLDEYAGNAAWCAGRDWRALAAEANERRLVEALERLQDVGDTLARAVGVALVPITDCKEGCVHPACHLLRARDAWRRASLAAAQAGTVVKEDFRPNEWPGSGSTPWPTLQEAGADDR